MAAYQLPMSYGKTAPVDALIGVVMRLCALGLLTMIAVAVTAFVFKEHGLPHSLGSRTTIRLLVPGLTALLCGGATLRLLLWMARGAIASDRQFVLWRRGVLAEMLFTGMGSFLIALGVMPNLVSGLGPLPLVVVFTGWAFLANPHAVLFDGDSQQVTVSGVLYASRQAFQKVSLAPLKVITRGSSFAPTFHVGLSGFPGGVMQLSLPNKIENVQRLIAHISMRTGVR